MKIKLKILLLSFLMVFFAGFIGSILMQNQSNSEWYESIKPSITPPSFVFPIVWTTLYVLIAISIYLVLASKRKNKKRVMVIFAINLFLNAIWTLFYFKLHNPILALIDIILIEITIISLILLTRKINKWSSYLLYPYLIWVSFAIILNFMSVY